MLDIQKLTDRLWANKTAKGFNIDNVEREFNFTYAELAEAYDAYRKQKPQVGEELADVFIYIASLARMLGVDLEAEILAKIDKNERREYRLIEGRHVRVEEAEESI